MAVTMDRLAVSKSRLRREQVEFYLIFSLSFLFFLTAATLSRLLPRQWRPFPSGPTGRRSIVGDAKVAADTTVPYAFMR